MSLPKLSIILPCYNEEEVLPLSIPVLNTLLANLISSNVVSKKSFLCFVDDGSRDNTWSIIEHEKKNDKTIRAIKFSRNFGHQNAILSGMLTFADEVDCCITIDVDLQDDVSVIQKMIEDYNEGNEIVYGVRAKRETDSFFKKWTALAYYGLIKKLGVELVYNHADFRLVGSRALEVIAGFKETNLFLRGLFPVLGFKTSIQYYDRKVRQAGETKYTLKKMLSLAWNGITSFSNKPLKIAMFIGWLTILASILLIGWALFQKFNGETLPGWTSTVIPIYFIGGIQLLFLGIIGEYIGKIYLETKQRPKYIIEEII